MITHNLSEQNSLLHTYLRELRDVNIQNDSMRFRRNIERIGAIMAYEVSKHLTYHTETIQTPLASTAVNVVSDKIVLGTIFRAGLPLHQGFLSMFDHAENAFVSAFRRVGTNTDGQPEIEIVSEYLATPCLDGKTLIIADPMLATGKSMEISYQALLSHGTPQHTHLCCVIGTPQAIELLSNTMPDNVTLWCAAVDPVLNEHKYIVPGLGDAGDLCFGDKL